MYSFIQPKPRVLSLCWALVGWGAESVEKDLWSSAWTDICQGTSIRDGLQVRSLGSDAMCFNLEHC